MGGILVGQLQKPHTTAVGLLFYTLGGKDCVYYLTGTGTDPLRPFAETVTIPLKLVLMVFWHVFRNCAVLSLASIQTTMRSNTIMVVKDFNGAICNPYIHLVFYIFIWN